MIDVAVVFVLFGGVVITTAGVLPEVTLTEALPGPNALVHWTVIVFPPATRATLFVLALVDAVPLTVQVVPAGIVVEPLTV